MIGHDPFRDFEYFRGKIGIVFQNDRLMPWRTALANVMLGLQILDVEPAKAEQVGRGWLARLGLAGHENDYPHALSGGMRQRVRSRARSRSSRNCCCATSRSPRSTR